MKNIPSWLIYPREIKNACDCPVRGQRLRCDVYGSRGLRKTFGITLPAVVDSAESAAKASYLLRGLADRIEQSFPLPKPKDTDCAAEYERLRDCW